MKKEFKKELSEFEALVNEVRGDCDKCKMDCRQRLQWLDSLVESLRYQLAKALALNQIMLKAVNKVADIQNIDKELARLTAKILQKEVGPSKGPHHDTEQEQDIDEILSAWH